MMRASFFRVFLLAAAVALVGCAGMVSTDKSPAGSTPGGGPGASPAGPGMGAAGAAGGSSNPGAPRPEPSGSGGSSAGGAISADAGASSASDASPASSPGVACADLVPLSAPSFQDLPAAPGARLRVRVSPAVAAPGQQWDWTVLYGDGAGREIPTTPLDAQRSAVELPLEQPGRYRISASAVGPADAGIAPCQVSAIAFGIATSHRIAQYRIRFTPPPELGFPVQESVVQVQADTPLMQPLVLQRGAEVTLDPHDETGTRGVTSYVRVTEIRSALTFEGYTERTPFRALLLPSLTYDVLFVPQGEFAPVVHTGKTPAALNVLPLQLTPGTALTGHFRDSAGAPVRDTRLALRAAALASTVGIGDAAGAFTLRARPGVFAVAVSPPPGSGLPELSLAPESGLVVPDAPSAGTAEISWAALVTAPVSLVVRGAAGSAAAGARIQLERDAPLPDAGRLTLQPPTGPAINRALQGQARASGDSRADGSLDLGPLPAGRYRVTAVPGVADQTSALTTALLDVGPAGLVAGEVRLGAKVPLRGTITPGLPGTDTAGTRVFAAPRAADPPRPSATVVMGAGGAYELRVDPGRDYTVWADPPAGRGLARALVAQVSAGPTGAEVPARVLPRTLRFAGAVLGERMQTLGGVLLQVYCDLSAPSCLDPTLSLAETVSGPQGEFVLGLPDPGSL